MNGKKLIIISSAAIIFIVIFALILFNKKPEREISNKAVSDNIEAGNTENINFKTDDSESSNSDNYTTDDTEEIAPDESDYVNNNALKELNPIIKQMGMANILVDPRIELLSSVMVQLNYPHLTKFNFDYKDDIIKYSKDNTIHKATLIFEKLYKRGFSYDTPPTSMLYLSNPPHLAQKMDFSQYIIDRASGINNLNNFVDSLRSFYIDNNFEEFFIKNASFYEEMVDRVYNNIKDLNIVEVFDEYYGMDVNSYNIVLAPMFHNGGYGPQIENSNGLYDLYAILGPNSVIEREGKTLPEFSTHEIQSLIWHEFSHSFVNPLTEKYIDEINLYSNLFDRIKNSMTKQAYNTWEICVNEHIVRAVTARLTYIYSGKDAGDQLIENEKKQSFFYIEAMCESLKNYENNRDKYPTFESYYPELIQVFKDLSEQNLPDSFYQIEFTGPINLASFMEDNLDVVIIIPTNEADDNVQEDLHDYVKELSNILYPNAKIINDTDALKMDLGNCIIKAFGTMDGNLWLSKYKDSFPFRIEDDKIIADKTYEGTGLKFITAMPNPQNYKNPLIIYTAQEAKDIINITNIFHGPADFDVIKNNEVIYSGYYRKDKEKWTFQDENGG